MAVYYCIGISRNYRCVLFAYVLGEYIREINVMTQGEKNMMKINMTDNLYELRKFVLEDLIKEGHKYIARDKDGAIFAYSRKPNRQDEAWYLDEALNDDIYQNISLVSRIFTDIKWGDEKPFEIPCTNWKEVPVNTPVVYTGDNWKTLVRHFCRYDEESNRVFIYTDGRTSFTGRGTMEVCPERVAIYEQGEK